MTKFKSLADKFSRIKKHFGNLKQEFDDIPLFLKYKLQEKKSQQYDKGPRNQDF
jgi:hypothetical protein